MGRIRANLYFSAKENRMMKRSIPMRLGMSAFVICFALVGFGYMRIRAQEPKPKVPPPPVSTAVDNAPDAIPTRVVNTPVMRAARQVWEYKAVSAKGVDATVLTSQIVGAGQEGYELVSITSSDVTNSTSIKTTEWVAVLKRPQ
jgi:hypothetical protein